MLSVTRKVMNLSNPVTVLSPEITPVLGFNVNPDGRVDCAEEGSMLHVYGRLGLPDACKSGADEYERPEGTGSGPAVVITKPEAWADKLSVAEAWFGKTGMLSDTVNANACVNVAVAVPEMTPPAASASPLNGNAGTLLHV